MKTRSQLLGLSIALIMVLICALPAMAKDIHTGKIVFASGNKLVITDVDEVNETFVVAENAKITRNGKEASLTDLAVDDAVKVTSSEKDGKKIATAIDARSDM